DCVKGGETNLEMVVDNKEDGEFVYVSEEIELFDHCSMDMVKSFKVDQMNHQKLKAPCLVFDAVGRQRGAGLEGGMDERKQTLHELLTEIEGFLVTRE
nr:ATP-dependent zinc metalloprotease FTSH, chloroplastic [Tanacetum cinerariifolium]